MMKELSVSEFDGWFDFYLDEPWGYELDMSIAARLWTITVNSSLENPDNFVNAADYYPKHQVKEEQPEEEDSEQQIEEEWKKYKAKLSKG